MKPVSMSQTPPTVIVGCGYVGQRLARQLRAEGCAVTGLVRSAASVAALQMLGVSALQVDLDMADVLPACAGP